MSPEAYARQLKALLPRGSVWRSESSSVLSGLLLAISEELARIDARSDVLLEEWDPRTAVELLADWERVLGLPEVGQVLPAAVADRQVLASTKLAAQGGQTAAYFIEVAALAGFPGTWTDVPAVHTWRMHVPLALATVAYDYTETLFRAGTARAGDPVAIWTVPQLETVIRRLSPAHTVVWFLYT